MNNKMKKWLGEALFDALFYVGFLAAYLGLVVVVGPGNPPPGMPVYPKEASRLMGRMHAEVREIRIDCLIAHALRMDVLMETSYYVWDNFSFEPIQCRMDQAHPAARLK